MRSTIGVDVDAPPELVFRLARDVERWPRLLPHYVAVRPIERDSDGALLAEMVARRPFVPVLGLSIPVAWRARTWSEAATCRLRFIHQGGATNGMDVTWRISARGGGARVEIDHEFRPRIGPWADFIDRAFTRPIASRTLATFKAIAEAVTAAERSESAAPSATNPST